MMSKKTKGILAAVVGIAVVALFFWFGFQSPSSPAAVSSSNDTMNTTPNPDLGSVVLPDDAFTDLSGVKVADVVVGTGKEITEGDMVSMHYVGKLADGTVFDSSLGRGQPLTFPYGAHQLIAGMEIGISGMRIGGLRRILIPAALAYGATGIKDQNGNYVIPPNSALQFDVQIVGIGAPGQ